MKINPRTIAIGVIFITAAIWGVTFVTQKIAGEHMGAFTYNGARFLLASITLIPAIYLLEKRTLRTQNEQNPPTRKTTWLAGAFGGIIIFFAANLQQFGIILSDSPSAAGEAGFITGMYIIFVPILGLFLGRRVRGLVWVSAALAFGGLALITIGPGGLATIQTTDMLLVACAVFWAVHILLIDRFANQIKPITFVAVKFLVCGALSAAAALIFESPALQHLIDGLWVLLFGGVVASGLTYTLQTLAQRHVEPALAAIIFSLEALFAALSEALFLGDTMTPQKYLGGGIIFIGILLAQHKKKKPPD
ncbi:MAG: DMT family transporter [Clostridiales bacterium]|nr:DMT family transporter [Clostridiales bacterium]